MKSILVILSILCVDEMVGQESKEVGNVQFDQTIKSYLRFSVPTISCSTLVANYNQYLILDTRTHEEYQVSHLKGSKHVGYDDFRLASWRHLPKNQPILLYCSIGYRSEKIGEKLKREGFTQVYNLYGSIFEWVNQGNTVVDLQGQTTTRLHTYNQKWSKWVFAENIKKVW